LARLDCPTNWPNLVPDLIGALKAPQPLVQHRSLLIFHHLVKALASKRMIGDRRVFQVHNYCSSDYLKLLRFHKQYCCLWKFHSPQILIPKLVASQIFLPTTFTHEMDCEQTGMGLPLVTSPVFLIAKF
jgi:hypothetical protein